MTAPVWMSKHPCVTCGKGYGYCAQFLKFNKMCCAGCKHPTRWKPNPYTDEEILEMWIGHEDIPPYVEEIRQRLSTN
jgi:hypothetical protein